jgi:hypothetical protein
MWTGSTSRFLSSEQVGPRAHIGQPLERHGLLADAGQVFFTCSEELKQSRFVPLVVDAMADLGGTPTRPEVVARAIELGRFTDAELAFPSHRQQDRAKGRSAVQGTLRYAIWYARARGDLLDGDTGGHQVLTSQGRAKVGAATGYPELDARRIMPQEAGVGGAGSSVADQLRALGVKGVLVQMAEHGQLLALKCEMPQCYHHKGRGAFDPVTTPRTKWAPSPDHYPILKSAGGHLVPENVRLSHIWCNNRDYGWRRQIRTLLAKGKSLAEIAEALNGKGVPPAHGTNRWTAAMVRKAYAS